MHRSIAPAFLDRPHVRPACWPRLDRVGLAVDDVDSSPVGHPPGIAAGEVLVGVCNTAIVFLSELVCCGARIGIPAEPKLLDELLFFLRSGKLLENRLFIVGNNVNNILFQPLLEMVIGIFTPNLLWRFFLISNNRWRRYIENEYESPDKSLAVVHDSGIIAVDPNPSRIAPAFTTEARSTRRSTGESIIH